MFSLTKQAEILSKDCLLSEGGFVFCDKIRSEFCTARYAMPDMDNYAFKMNYQYSLTTSYVDQIIIRMRDYCLSHGLEYREK